MRADYVIEDQHAGQALRNALAELIPGATAKSIRKNIQRGQITVNGNRVASNYPLNVGDQVCVHIQTQWAATTTSIDVIFEDDHIAILNKPAGLLTNSKRKPSLATTAGRVLRSSEASDALITPVTLHRLDKETSGLIICCKTQRAVRGITDQFESRSILKLYRAIAVGEVAAPQVISTDLDGKEAMTEITESIPKDGTSLLKVLLHTGRKNQIRRHLAEIGHPIVGDKRYGVSTPGQSMALCANKLQFAHPIKLNTITFEIDAPFPG